MEQVLIENKAKNFMELDKDELKYILSNMSTKFDYDYSKKNF